MTVTPATQAAAMLTKILTWCARHPWNGGDLATGDLTFQQHYIADSDTRIVSVLGPAPEVAAFSVDLLDQANPTLVTFDHQHGLLTVNVVPELLYQPLYVGRRAETVVFRRVCARCHNSRKVPDWGNWNEEYGEPRPKPCPDCADWEWEPTT